MTPDRLDDETLAAFVDGTLAPAERARVLGVLATDPEAYADFLEAAQVAAEVNASPTVASIDRKRRRTWFRPLLTAAPFLAAAGIAGIFLYDRSDASHDAISLMQNSRLAANEGSGSISAALGEEWDRPGWTVVRGAGPAAASPGTAARIGARMAQLEFAAAAGDDSAYQRAAATLHELLAAVEGAGPIAVQLAEPSINAAEERALLARQLRTVTGNANAFDAGAWLETARLAAVSGRTEFLAPGGPAIATLRDITAALERAPPPGEWDTILALLRQILRDYADADLTREHVVKALAAIPR